MQAPTPHSRQVPHRSLLKPSHWHRLRDVQPQPCASSPAPAKAAPAPCLILLFNYSSTSMSEASDAKSRSALAAGQMSLCAATQNNPVQTLSLAEAGSRSAAALRKLAVTACKPPIGLDVQAPLPTAPHSLPECRQLPASTCWITELKQAGLACTCWQSP